MSERYWITGAQLGMLTSKHVKQEWKKEFTDEVSEKQFIGNYRTKEEQKAFAEFMRYSPVLAASTLVETYGKKEVKK